MSRYPDKEMLKSWRNFDTSVKLCKQAHTAEKVARFKNLLDTLQTTFYKYDEDFGAYKDDTIKKTLKLRLHLMVPLMRMVRLFLHSHIMMLGMNSNCQDMCQSEICFRTLLMKQTVGLLKPILPRRMSTWWWRSSKLIVLGLNPASAN